MVNTTGVTEAHLSNQFPKRIDAELV